VEVLQATGLASSRSQARRTIDQGGAYVNNRRISEAGYALQPADLAGRNVVVLRSGKKSYALARFTT
jgi:tyrosyl-tRNA synthetase